MSMTNPDPSKVAETLVERAAIVAWLRAGGESDARGWYAWDTEMRGYADSFARRIEQGSHLIEQQP